MTNQNDNPLQALQKLLNETRLGIVRVPLPRDYVPCQWCDAKGCAACFAARERRRKELDEEYKRRFPDGPKPFFTAKLDNPDEMESAKRVLGREALEAAFGPEGRGVEQIIEAGEAEMAKRKAK